MEKVREGANEPRDGLEESILRFPCPPFQHFPWVEAGRGVFYWAISGCWNIGQCPDGAKLLLLHFHRKNARLPPCPLLQSSIKWGPKPVESTFHHKQNCTPVLALWTCNWSWSAERIKKNFMKVVNIAKFWESGMKVSVRSRLLASIMKRSANYIISRGCTSHPPLMPFQLSLGEARERGGGWKIIVYTLLPATQQQLQCI